MMSFHKQMQRELTALPYAAEQQQLGGGDGSGVLRTEMHHFSSADDDGGKELHRLVKGANGPRWLNSGILRPQPGEPFGDGRFLHLQTASEPSASARHWFPRPPILHRDGGGGSDDEVPAASSDAAGISGACGELAEAASGEGTWQNARHKAEILAHPLYEQLLAAHVACLRIATPVDQLPRIDAQLTQSQQVVSKYSVVANGGHMLGDDKELDQFMTHYALLLCSFKEQLQQHVRVHAMEAVMACWELEQGLKNFTGVSPGEGTGATMSDDNDDDDNQVDSETNLFDGSFDGPDSMGFGPPAPTESDRGLMERVRQELKLELKQGYKEKIVDIREEILHKRRAGKLPGNSTSTLKAWWQSHSKWPYPTEDDKSRLVQETGLQLKQINNWFINQRKRNWQTNPSSSTSLKTKRKR
ncbi:homeobox protein knotted-1-like 2 [Curcuma longa]|uniref:homeobox protein knotted-1-like 2 n=1 Tax=Curcuma longa TaxID=136217 RepID=UPI003D9F7232